MSGSERAALRELKREMAERAETSLAITGLAQGRSVAETAQRICDAALGVHPVDMACISSVDSSGTLRLVAATGLDDRLREYIGEAIPADRAAALNAKAGTGPWVGGEGEWHSSRGGRAGPPVTIANVPLLWNERLVGIIALGARLEWGDLEPPQLAIAREFAAVAAALLGPQLVAEEEAAATRAAISGVIQSRAFRPAFQPVIELASGATVGFEALTRFSDGTRPDLRFAQAAKAGLGIPLELATLEAAVDEASLLPEGAWVSLNVSPELAVALVPLASILEGLDRRAVIEITEHTLFEDYEGLTTALATLRRNVRISIDDAGAGFAGLRRILELSPHFVKLDIALVRSVDTDPARRAMIGAMVAFARETGCAIIAEGIERDEECDVLRALGVDFGQGYLLGRPAAVEAWTHVPQPDEQTAA